MHLSLFNQYNTKLFEIAYRMLGCVSDAEDVLQDAWVKWHKIPLDDIESAEAYLSKMVARLSIDTLRKRKLREYKGPWLPEPVATETGPYESLETMDNLGIATLFLLENLTPQERAVFVLKESMGMSHGEISDILGVDVANSRKLLSRAKTRIPDGQGMVPNTTTKTQQAALTEFLSALVSGDIDQVASLLAEDAVAYTDGGGVVSAALIPLVGLDKIFTVFSHLIKNNESLLQVRWLKVNTGDGLAIFSDHQLVSVIVVELKRGKISSIFVQRNPNKLKHLKQAYDRLSVQSQ